MPQPQETEMHAPTCEAHCRPVPPSQQSHLLPHPLCRSFPSLRLQLQLQLRPQKVSSPYARHHSAARSAATNRRQCQHWATQKRQARQLAALSLVDLQLAAPSQQEVAWRHQ
ncbi:hypothetical protein DQ04_10581040 [Trypanosoma grayi]|uniref:hypothetical protein n=1 Tax=Trypanosoma grayi TaxID=71804 RepID=UPI0004F43D8B|nr:hypothetical protein DQ04_10581040 [Trypanosoma grayi]KEG07201.1 hypothetical protein DQ04_10581040 [Trypanosoma grayi]